MLGSSRPSPKVYHYRTKLTPHPQEPPPRRQRLAWQQGAEASVDYSAIGFLEQDWGDARDASGRRWRKVVDVRSCPIATEYFSECVHEMRKNRYTQFILAVHVSCFVSCSACVGAATYGSDVEHSDKELRRIADSSMEPKKSYEEVHGKVPGGHVKDSKGLAQQTSGRPTPKKSYEEVHGKIPSGPVIDSEGLAVQTGSGAPVKKSYEEVHGKMSGGPVIDEEGLAVQSTGEDELSKET
eukprot:s1603_g18.t1